MHFRARCAGARRAERALRKAEKAGIGRDGECGNDARGAFIGNVG